MLWSTFSCAQFIRSCPDCVQITFDTFASECTRRGLRLRRRTIQPNDKYDGVLGRAEEYEGGFLLMAVDLVSSPGTWHSDNFNA